MAKSGTCDVCGRSVTITTDRGEYVATGLEGHEYSDGTVRCEGNKFGPTGVCMTTENGEAVALNNDA